MEYTIQKGALTAVVDTMGGELVSLRDGSGTEYIWNGDARWWTGRNPILFPVIGNLIDGKITFRGREYSMKSHGFARRQEFSFVSQEEDSVTLSLHETEETLAQYPYPFLLLVTHRVTEKGFVTECTVRNTGREELPYCLGAHTAIRCPMKEDKRFEEYSLVFEKEEDASTWLLDEKGIFTGETMPILRAGHHCLVREEFAALDTLVFRNLQSKSVSLLSEDGHGVRLDFSGFPAISFWTKGDAPFLCLEPWQGLDAIRGESGRMEDKPYAVLLAPGEERTHSYSFEIV